MKRAGLATLVALGALAAACDTRTEANRDATVALATLRGEPTERDIAGRSLLYLAVTHGDAAEVSRLLALGVPAEVQGPGNRTAVTEAAIGGHVEIVRALIAAGADINLQDDTRSNAVLVTGETGNAAVLREVLKGKPDLSLTNRYGGTALIPAADRGHVEVVKLLLETSIDIDHVNDLGWTALLEAIVLGEGGAAHNEIVKLLLDAGADPNLADRDGVRPLEHARRRGYDEIAANLVAAGAR